MTLVGLDIGRRNLKLYTGKEFIIFPAVIGEWRELKLHNHFGKKAFEGEFHEKKFFAGVLAENESEYARQMLVDDKATPDALLTALIALHEAGLTEVDVMTGLPYSLHDEQNKVKLKMLLEGKHTIKVNGIRRIITIKRARVALEGGSAFWVKPSRGVVRIIDGGSKTINCITMRNKIYVDKESYTLDFGFDTNKSDDMDNLVTSIVGSVGKTWNANDTVLTVGGEANLLAGKMKEYFPRITPLEEGKTVVDFAGDIVDFNIFANSVGYYKLGQVI